MPDGHGTAGRHADAGFHQSGHVPPGQVAGLSVPGWEQARDDGDLSPLAQTVRHW